MGQMLNKLNWYKDQLKSGSIESWYVFCRETFSIKERSILLQSRYGDDLGGNIFRILKELSENYWEYTLYLAYKKSTVAGYKTLIRRYGIKNVRLIELHRAKYWYLLATCKYLVNDVTFHTAFIKREGQVYLNTWHGTPLKKMGLEEEESGYLFGNMQRNFLASDYFLCPSQYMTELMVRAYSLKHLFRGEFVNEGYPRNAVFFDKARRDELRKELGLERLQVIVYMPTWRGNADVNKSREYTEELQSYFDELDEKLGAGQVFFVKLHPMVSEALNLSGYRRIKSVPSGYETYDFLNTADCLVSDYSSVMFDFACTGRDIVLFAYDEKEYMLDRGLYIPLSSLPFKQARTVEQLVQALHAKESDYNNNAFIKGITAHENRDAAKHLCEKLLKGAASCAIRRPEDNRKQNVFIFVDKMVKNGITASAFNLINSIDITKRNYFFVFRREGAKENRERLREIPEGVGLLSLDTVERTLGELAAGYLYFKKNRKNRWIQEHLDKGYQRAFEKYFGNVRKEVLIQFVGYGRDPLHIFRQADTKFVFVHNDMKRELEAKTNQHRLTVIDCYQNYTKVLGVSRKVTGIAAEIAGHKGSYATVHNCFDYRKVLEKSRLPLTREQEADYVMEDGIRFTDLLQDKSLTKFVTVGRFSPEKEHRRLLDAFNMYWKEKPETYLLIIGGYGSYYEDTVSYARQLPCRTHVILIRGLRNPYNVLACCDLFVLSSSYEGLPVVIMEADCLGLPVLSTDISGPRELLNFYGGGLLAEENAPSLYRGMLAAGTEGIKLLNIDFSEYNKECVRQFEQLFTNGL